MEKKCVLEVNEIKKVSWKRVDDILIHLRKKRCFTQNVELQFMEWYYFVISVDVRYTAIIMNILEAQMMKKK